MWARIGALNVLLLAVVVFATAGNGFSQNEPKKEAKKESATTATIVVVVPHPNTKLSFDNVDTQTTGEKRSFQSPELEPGKTYKYTVVAFWEPNNYTKITRTREIKLKAGETVELDLRPKDETQPDKIIVRYVPTPQEVVEEMMKLAAIEKGDIVYDLGCGDGRLVVTAVSKYGAKRGVGVDIDPERIKESKENAKAANVQDKVEFRMDDVLKMKDISDANVVLLYMGEALNQQMRPILRKTLKPGSRVVSHRFTMGDWKPNKTIVVKDDDGEEYKLHLWIITEDDKNQK